MRLTFELHWVRKNRLFFKIFMYFLALLIPIIVIGWTTYFKANQLIKKNVSENLNQHLDFSVQTIDSYLNMTQSLNNNLFYTAVVQQNLIPYDKQTDQEKINMPFLVKTIAANQNMMSSFIYSIFIYNDDQKVYTGDSIYDFDFFFDRLYHFSDLPGAFWTNNLRSDKNFELLKPQRVSDHFNHAEWDVIPSISTQYLNGTLTTIATTISVHAIAGLLEDNSTYAPTSYLAFDSNGNPILSTGGLTTEQTRRIVDGFSGGKTARMLELRLGGQKVMITHSSSDLYGWDYYSLTPVSAFNQEPDSILKLILWVCVSLFVIGLLFSLIFSLRLYNPIKNMRDILMQNGGSGNARDESASNDEFQLIGSRIHQLFEHNRDVISKMDRFSDELLEKLFADSLYGRSWADRDTADELLEKYGFGKDNYLCCCLLFKFSERFYRDIAEADRLLIQEKLKKVLWGILSHQVNGYLLEPERQLYVFAANLQKDGDRARLDLALNKVRITFEYDVLYCDLIIGVGKAYDRLSELYKSFGDALTAIDMRPTEATNSILDAANMDIEQSYYYSFLDEIKVLNSLKSGDKDLLHDILEEIIEINRKRGVGYPYLGHLLVMLFNTGYRYLVERPLSERDFLTESEHASLGNPNLLPGDYEERLRLLFRFYDGLADETEQHLEGKSGTVVSLITNYIEENYDKEIYLERIADEVGLSAKHISSVFKKMTGSTITNYVSLIRMTKAKELLTQTDLKIGDIAAKVGIFSRTTFLRQFKNHTGVSPADYRKSAEESPES